MVESLSQQRSQIIEKFINIETIINAIISQHYLGKPKKNFIFEVLYDEYFSFALKRRILIKICPSFTGKLENQLNRLATIRNYFAHLGLTIIEGSSNEGPQRTPDPRDFNKSINFNELYKEFNETEPVITKRLFDEFTGKGGISD